MPTLLQMGAENRLGQLELRPWGLFTDVVPEVDLDRQGNDRTGLGAKWVTRGDYTLSLDTYTCIADDSIDSAIELTVSQEQLPFMQSKMMACSSVWVDMTELRYWLNDDARLTRSAALVRALTTQITANHLNFADDSDNLAASDNLTEAMGLVEDGLAERISNGRGYIFIPPKLLPYAVNDGGVSMVNGELVSPAGHRVVSDAGMYGLSTVFGTGAVGWSITDAKPVDAFEFSDNTLTAAYFRYGVVLFNPIHTVRTVVTVT